MEILDYEIYAEFTVLHAILALVAAAILVPVVRMIFGHKVQGQDNNLPASCGACSWRGQASRFAKRCPKCNAPISVG